METERLKHISLFSRLSDEEIEAILKLAFVKEYNEGFTLFVEGMKGGVMYVILDGETIISKKINGVETEIARLGSGDYFGELSLIENDARSATARLAKRSKLLVITENVFIKC